MLWFALALAVCASGIQTAQSKQEPVWNDEFDGDEGTSLNTSLWTYDTGDGSHAGIPGWGNDQLQYYTNSVNNIVQDGKGNLAIIARSENTTITCYYGQCQYTSGRIKSKYSGRYGRFEARLKTPRGKGLWPAFWMLCDNTTLKWPECGTIGIMELKGSDPKKVSGSLNGPGYAGAEALSQTFTLKKGTFADEFHVFAVDWLPTSIMWSVDGHPYKNVTSDDVKGKPWVFQEPFGMLLNVAVGGHFDGSPEPETTFPQVLLIDYVRVYEFDDIGPYSTQMPLGTGTSDPPHVDGHGHSTTKAPSSKAIALVLPYKLYFHGVLIIMLAMFR